MSTPLNKWLGDSDEFDCSDLGDDPPLFGPILSKSNELSRDSFKIDKL